MMCRGEPLWRRPAIGLCGLPNLSQEKSLCVLKDIPTHARVAQCQLLPCTCACGQSLLVLRVRGCAGQGLEDGAVTATLLCPESVAGVVERRACVRRAPWLCPGLVCCGP